MYSDYCLTSIILRRWMSDVCLLLMFGMFSYDNVHGPKKRWFSDLDCSQGWSMKLSEKERERMCYNIKSFISDEIFPHVLWLHTFQDGDGVKGNDPCVRGLGEGVGDGLSSSPYGSSLCIYGLHTQWNVCEGLKSHIYNFRERERQRERERERERETDRHTDRQTEFVYVCVQVENMCLVEVWRVNWGWGLLKTVHSTGPPLVYIYSLYM